jgi:hypothetical protein
MIIQKSFNLTVKLLLLVAKITNLTYNEINIIVYYFIVPFSYLFLLDIIFGFHYLKVSFVIFTVGFFTGCRNFKNYSDKLFKRSANFLLYFNRFGSNYEASSVIICLSLPLILFIVLIYLIFM